MSCQQASRFISNVSSSISVTPEDPYVFTETVSTVPPILFNTQKSRSRLNDSVVTSITAAATTTTLLTSSESSNQIALATTTQQIPITKSITNFKLPFNRSNGNVIKTQTSVAAASNTVDTVQQETTLTTKPTIVVAAATTTTSATVPALSPTVACLKNATQSHNQSQQQQLQSPQQNNKKFTTNLRQHPQQQQQQQLSPLLPLQHTPSLWQTPLLLDTATTVVSPPTSPASLPSPTTSLTMSIAATMVAPHVTTSAVPLPPSKFHNTTLAQHLEKVQCLKKPKKPTNSNLTTVPTTTTTITNNGNNINSNCNSSNSISNNNTVAKHNETEAKVVTSSAMPPLQAFDPPQHSDSDLNQIPVNVIFRKPQTSNGITRTLITGGGGGGGGGVVETGEKKNTENNLEETVGTITTSRNLSIKPLTSLVNKLKNIKVITSPPTLKNSIATPPPQQTSLNSTLPAFQDVIFMHSNMKSDASLPTLSSSPTLSIQSTTLKHEMSSIPISQHPQEHQKQQIQQIQQIQELQNDNSSSSPALRNMTVNESRAEKCIQTDSLYATHSKKPVTPKRKVPTGGQKSKIRLPSNMQKPSVDSTSNSSLVNYYFPSNINSTKAVAVVKMSAVEADADTSLLASSSVLPYCVQKHWLSIYEDSRSTLNSSHGCLLSSDMGREERIAQHKSLLRRQALQLLSTRSLQKQSLRIARKRLLCVDRLVRKYETCNRDEILNAKQCIYPSCINRALEMTSQCIRHIINDPSQNIFQPCSAKLVDNTQCRVPVFDIVHSVPLCIEHGRQYDNENRILNVQQSMELVTNASQQDNNDLYRQHIKQLSQISHNFNKKSNVVAKVIQVRKRKTGTSPNPVGRPQKRTKKTTTTTPPLPSKTTAPSIISLPPLSSVLQRKNSTTSLESLASNSQSSCSLSHSQSQQPYGSNTLAPPALAPLSGVGSGSGFLGASHRMLNFGASAAVAISSANDDFKTHEINQIVAQFDLVANNVNINHSFTNNINHSTNNSNNPNNNSYMNILNTNSNSNFTSSGLGSSSSLPDELLTQDMLSICENSSAYASSEDTGFGGLSETELMAGTHDADDIPLPDTRLLEEHDLNNVLNALSPDAFNELFTAVAQDECEEVERALELADKHLKSLQQTIGSDSDFLGDFLDVNEIFADTDACNKMGIISSVMHSPDTSGIDTSTLFIDSGSSSTGAANPVSKGPNISDIRGLVQT